MKKIIVLLFVAVATTIQAQDTQELNTLIQQSFNYFPRLKELTAASEISELRVDVAQSNYLPNVNGVGSYTYVNPISQKAFPGAPEALQFQPYNNYNVNVGVNQLVWDFGKTKAQVEKAKADLLAAKQNTEAVKLQLGAQVASIYYSMIYLKRAITLQDSVISFYRNNHSIVEGKIKQGDALQIDLSNMQNNIDVETNRKVEFQRQFARQQALMRYTTGENFEPSAATFGFSSGQSPTDMNNNPDLIAATERINAAQADLRLAQSNKLPTLSFQGGAGFKNGYQPDIDKMRFNVLAGLTLNVPIFQGGRIRQTASIAQKSVQLSEYTRSNVATSLQRDVESAQADVRAYEDQIKNSDGQIKTGEENLRLTQVRYKQGVVTYLDLTNSSTILQRAFLSKLQFEYQRTLAQVELCRLYGMRFWQ